MKIANNILVFVTKLPQCLENVTTWISFRCYILCNNRQWNRKTKYVVENVTTWICAPANLQKAVSSKCEGRGIVIIFSYRRCCIRVNMNINIRNIRVNITWNWHHNVTFRVMLHIFAPKSIEEAESRWTGLSKHIWGNSESHQGASYCYFSLVWPSTKWYTDMFKKKKLSPVFWHLKVNASKRFLTWKKFQTLCGHIL